MTAEPAKVFEDRRCPGDWRVEWVDDDGGVEVAIFSGPNAREWALRYAERQYPDFEVTSPGSVSLTPRPASAWRSTRRTFLGRRRSRRRRFLWRARQLRPNGAQQPDAWRQRIAIVGDHAVQKTKERRSFLVG